MSLPRDKPSTREFLQSSVIYSAFHISYLGSPKTSVRQDVFHRRSRLCVRELRRSYGLSPRTWNPLCQVFSSTVFPVLSENPAVLISSTVILQLPRSNGLAVPWIPWHCVSSLPHILRGLCPFYNVRRCLWCSVRSRGECNSNLWRDTFIDSLTILNLQGMHLDHMSPNSSRHFHGLSQYPQHHFQVLSFLFFLFCNPESLVSVSCWNVGLFGLTQVTTAALTSVAKPCPASLGSMAMPRAAGVSSVSKPHLACVGSMARPRPSAMT